MNQYQPVIGLEVHVELKTKSKMFCKCLANYFGEQPNTHTCPTCLGLPGALPFINKQAIDDCIKIGLSLDCQISEKSLFERKNYFYPDLPKGYQISQYRWPLCLGGKLQLENGKWIRINRVHQEEDTGKLTHQKDTTLIDFNRSGVPLVEIVTEPDFTDVLEISDYAKKLQQLFRYLGVSNADMEQGEMRLEANVSVRKTDGTDHTFKLPNYRVELKNINSFRFMREAVEYEIKRQIKQLEQGQLPTQETRGWDENKKCTYVQRVKEEANDYRYFPEPDLSELVIDKSSIEKLQQSLPELPWDKAQRFEKEWKIKKTDAQILAATKELAQFFEDAVAHGLKHQIKVGDIANYIINKKPDIDTVLPTQIIELIKGKQVGIISDEEQLTELAKQAITQTPQGVNDYKMGKTNALQVLIGVMMRLSQGKADPIKAVEVLKDLLRD